MGRIYGWEREDNWQLEIVLILILQRTLIALHNFEFIAKQKKKKDLRLSFVLLAWVHSEGAWGTVLVISSRLVYLITNTVTIFSIICLASTRRRAFSTERLGRNRKWERSVVRLKTGRARNYFHLDDLLVVPYFWIMVLV